jgi:hypothetical protein
MNVSIFLAEPKKQISVNKPKKGYSTLEHVMPGQVITTETGYLR